MGSVYSIECECGYSLSVSQGVGLFYPRQCERIMQSIREGDYGEEMKKAAETVPHAAVCCSSGLFRCPNCGDYTGDEYMALCAPIGEYKPRRGRFSSACSGEGIDYVMPYDIGRDYYVVLQEPVNCPNCGTEAESADIRDKGL